MTMPRRAAFFDVDETLISVKSMFQFLQFHLAARGLPPAVYDRVRADLDQLTAAGWTREKTNRAYYRIYANQSVAGVAEQGEAWFAEELANGGFFVPEILAALECHRHSGDLTVLVSGSFPPCVEPIARHVGADVLACTRPEIVDGVYTGSVEQPVIGAAKAAAVRDVVSGHQLVAAECFAYGDHATDLPMLRAVGNPVVVGNDLILRTVAHDSGWQLMSEVNASSVNLTDPP